MFDISSIVLANLDVPFLEDFLQNLLGLLLALEIEVVVDSWKS